MGPPQKHFSGHANEFFWLIPASLCEAGTMSTVEAVCLQVKLFYDVALHQLVVTIISAVELPPRDNGQPRNPYCKLYLLPDRR